MRILIAEDDATLADGLQTQVPWRANARDSASGTNGLAGGGRNQTASLAQATNTASYS